MAGFASALGGLGKAAGDYGAQVRGILEARRGNIANAMLHLASEETDPDRRNEYIQHGVDALSGKDMSKLAPALIKTVQGHIEGNKILADAFPQGQSPAPQQIPASVPGQTPGTGSAVQPSSSPVQPNSTPMGGFTPVQHTAAPAPAPQPPIPPIPPVAGGIPGMPVPQGVQAIMAKYQNSPLMQTPAGRKILEPMIQQEVQHSQILAEELQRQQATIALRQHGLEQMRAEPGYSQLPQFAQMGYEAQAHGFTPINTPNGALVPDKLQIDTTGMSPESKTAYGIPADAKGKFTVEMDRMTRQPFRAYPGWAGTQSTTNSEGVKGIESTNAAMANGGALTSVGGGASLNPSLTTPKTVSLASGEQGLISPAQVSQGKSPTGIPGSVVPALLPHTTQSMKSVQSVDPVSGQPITVLTPVTSTRTVGKGSSVPPAQAGNPGSGTPPPVPPVGGTLPRGSISFPKTSENQLTGEGQKSVAQIDDVLSQITDLRKKLEDRGLSNKNDRDYYPEYLKYMHGGEATPNQDIWTGLSFEGLRSAAAAMRGTNSRALPIIEKALEHTPNPSARFSLTNGHLPDTPANMYNKLGEMEQILRTGRGQALNDQKKSGVVPPIGPSAGAKPAAASGSIRVRRKSDGQTGTIDAADFNAAKYDKIQ